MLLYKSLDCLVLLISVFLNCSYFVRTENMKRCYYSRYMLFFFKLHEMYFERSFENWEEDSSALEDLQTYEASLRGQGQTVLALLDDLMSHIDQPPVRAEDLMAVNLFLNNVSGSLLVRTLDGENIVPDSPDNKATALRDQLKESGKKMIKHLLAGINENCPQWSDAEYTRDMIQRDSETQSRGYDHLNALLPESHVVYGSVHLPTQLEMYTHAVNDSLLEMKYLLKPTFNRQTYKRYHPKRLLFYRLLLRPEDLVDSPEESQPDDRMQLLRQVTLVTKLEDDTYPDMEVLFKMAQTCFHVGCLRSYQQQVLAATVHPALSAVGWYVSLVELFVFNTGDDGKFKDVPARVELFGKRLDDLGDSVLNAFVAFIRLAILPAKVLDHLKKTALELDDLVKREDKENIQSVASEWMGQISRRCSRPMSLNKLRVTRVEEFISIDSEENCIEALDVLQAKVDKVGEYVKALENHKKIYHSIVSENPFFSHENMFVYEPECDIITENKRGYSILVGSKPEIKSDQESQSLDA